VPGKEIKNLRIVPFSVNHVNDAVRIEQVSFPTPWSYDAFISELKLRNTKALVALLSAEEGERVAGYILGRFAADEMEITNLAVHPELRRRGIARALLWHLVERVRSRGIKKIFLEVRENNKPAIRLYEKFGFKKVGIRRGYYVDTGEDALVMRLETE